MSERRRMLTLAGLVLAAALVVQIAALWLIYLNDLDQTRRGLEQQARTVAQALLLLASEHYDLSAGPPADLSMLMAHYDLGMSELDHFGRSGEITVGRLQGSQVMWLNTQRFEGRDSAPVDNASELVMARAASGFNGALYGRDYRGEMVVAGTAYIPELEVGVTAKMDVAEVLDPILRTAAIVSAGSLLVAMLAAWLFVAITRPLLKRVEHSERLHRELLDSINLPILALTRDGRIEYCNRRFMQIVAGGDDSGTVKGKHVLEVWPRFQELQSFAAYTEVLRSGKPAFVSAPMGSRWFDAHLVPTPEGVLGIAEDVTERRAEARALRRFASLVQSSDDAIIGQTPEGIITDWNNGATRIYGYTGDEAIGKHISFLVPPELHGELDEVLARIQRGEMVKHFETQRLTKDGRRIEVALTISPMLDAESKVVGISIVARDVSTQKRLERELDEMRYKDTELSAIRRTAGGVAHEVNNPLAGLIVLLDMLVDDIDRQNGADVESLQEQRQLLRDAQEQAQRIRKVIGRLSAIVEPRYRSYAGNREILDLGSDEAVRS